jgi:hypothetical protein
LEKPVHVVGYPVKNFENLPDLNLNLDYDFNFLCVAQAGPRKNIEKTVDYFYKTFKDKKVGLVLKISKANACVRDRTFCMNMLQNFKQSYQDAECKVYLLHGAMTDEEVHALYVHPKIKCLLSLTHGEGFGLPLFEAAYSGLPIISHEWGGQTDFLFVEENGKKKAHFARVEFDLKTIQPEAAWEGLLEKDSMWAYPKEFSACTKMMEVYKDHGRFKGQAKKLKEYLLNINFDKSRYTLKFETKLLNSEKLYLKKWFDTFLHNIGFASIATTLQFGYLSKQVCVNSPILKPMSNTKFILIILKYILLDKTFLFLDVVHLGDTIRVLQLF